MLPVPTDKVHYSRFADRIPVTVLIAIRARPGLESVTICTWILRGDKWSLCPLEIRSSYEKALKYVPIWAERVLDVPSDFARSAWLIRKPGETKRI